MLAVAGPKLTTLSNRCADPASATLGALIRPGVRSAMTETSSPVTTPLHEALSVRGFVRGQLTSPNGILVSLVVNGIAPLIAYQVLTGRGVPQAQALAMTAIFPVLGMAFALARTRRADGIAIVALALIGIGVAGTLLTNDPRFYLVRVSFGTGLFGLICLGSLLARRPLLFYLNRQVIAGGDAGRAAYYDGLWESARFRRVQRVMTATWGVSYVIEAGVRFLVAWTLPIGVVLVIEPLLAYVVLFALIAWSVGYGRAQLRLAGETPPD